MIAPLEYIYNEIKRSSSSFQFSFKASLQKNGGLRLCLPAYCDDVTAQFLQTNILVCDNCLVGSFSLTGSRESSILTFHWTFQALFAHSSVSEKENKCSVPNERLVLNAHPSFFSTTATEKYRTYKPPREEQWKHGPKTRDFVTTSKNLKPPLRPK